MCGKKKKKRRMSMDMLDTGDVIKTTTGLVFLSAAVSALKK